MSSERWAGGQVSARALCVLAPNPGPMTLDGTNSWLLVEPGSSGAVLVDPGPDDPGHTDRLLAAADRARAQVSQIVLTHGHADHAAGARRLQQVTGAPIRALDPRLADDPLASGEVLEVAGLVLQVMATPGHTNDSLALVLAADHAILTGDTVLGRGTAVIAHPDGHLGHYLDSLQQLAQVARDLPAQQLLPGHGPVRRDPVALIDHYRSHRQERLARVAAAMAAGATGEQLLEAAYPEVPAELRWAARLSLAAQVAHLAERAPGRT